VSADRKVMPAGDPRRPDSGAVSARRAMAKQASAGAAAAVYGAKKLGDAR